MKMLLAVLLALVCSCSSQQEGPASLPASFFKGHAINVLYFLSADCPLSQSYVPTIAAIAEQHCDHDISFKAVFPSQGMNKMTLEQFREEYKLEIPCMIDSDRTVTRALGASITPEVFVCDSTGRVLYSGRIDNWAYDTGRKRTKVTEHDLENALDDLVAGKPVRQAHTQAIGCFIENE